MRYTRTPAEMAALADDARRQGQRIAFVPTMGALHAGHASLLTAARTRGDLVVLSIFLNPLQFGPNEDLSRYPRTPEADETHAHAAGVDVIYAPTPESMYPHGYQTSITVTELARGLDGDVRPGHFSGVATVVCKLFAAVRPHVALFGQKDYQQLQLIRRMVRDLDLGVDVVGMPIVRDADGLALSSRNVYLSEAERSRALSLSRALHAVEAAYAAGERDARALLQPARVLLAPALEAGHIALDYLELRNADSLSPIAQVTEPAVALIAARVGTTRLIDNALLGTS